ncbi:MAG: alpha/beta hydrolase [Saprospiraceae bacterium]|nr:alpha/beta hydrolase [Saprospiraceae bacterium]
MSKPHYSTAFGLFFTLFHTFIFAQQNGNPFPKVSNPNEQTYKIKTAGSLIEGVLRVPKTTASAGETRFPLVFIVPDAGGTDRDGNMGEGVKAAPYRYLSESLTANGIATFRYDKRGVGNSTFEERQKPIVFEDFIGDAQKCLDSLQATGKFGKIIVAGHGEGALVAMILAQRTPFDGFISLAASAKRIDTFMVDQVRRGSPELAYYLRVVYDKWQKMNPLTRFQKGLKIMFSPLLSHLCWI